ncbi:MAG: 2-oxoacid:acceptor oxidoreductase family protein, partial [Deltaproteobacteria bacterium]|nr:2-oxoacid:acceptor oxidoreductase family protein [Deltaproteobacteria bacterium]
MRPGKLEKDPFNVIISGVGGQGNVLLSGFIGAALVKEGLMVSVADTFGVSQRGGSVASHIKISEKTLYSSVTLKGKADLLIGMEPVETLRALVEFGNPGIISIVNPRQ